MQKQLQCIQVLGCKSNSYVELCTRSDNKQTVVKYYPKISRAMLIETSILASVNHSNVMGLIDIVCDPDRSPTALCLPVGGPTLAEVLQSQTLLLTTRVIILLQIAYGLRHLHANNILHLDLKADNILVDSLEPPACRIIDFGTSEYLALGCSSLQTYQSKCTSTYRAPEGFVRGDEGATLGYAADIWSFGIIAYELLVGIAFPLNLPIFEELRDKDSSERDDVMYRYISSDKFQAVVRSVLPHGLDLCLLLDPKLRPCINHVICLLTNYLDMLDPGHTATFDSNLEFRRREALVASAPDDTNFSGNRGGGVKQRPYSRLSVEHDNWYANCLYSRVSVIASDLVHKTCTQICERILDYQLASTETLDADVVAMIIHASGGMLYSIPRTPAG